jgi:hypothetical protein
MLNTPIMAKTPSISTIERPICANKHILPHFFGRSMMQMLFSARYVNCRFLIENLSLLLYLIIIKPFFFFCNYKVMQILKMYERGGEIKGLARKGGWLSI